MKKAIHTGFWKGFNITAVMLIPAFLFIIPFIQAFEGFGETVDLFLLEHTQMGFQGTSTISLVLENPEKTPLNAIEFELSYDPSKMAINTISAPGILCEERFILSNVINNASGTALFQCGTITPFLDTYGTVALIEINRFDTTTTTLSFGQTTSVLAHDGYGTDATRNVHNLVLHGN